MILPKVIDNIKPSNMKKSARSVTVIVVANKHEYRFIIWTRLFWISQEKGINLSILYLAMSKYWGVLDSLVLIRQPV